MNPFRALPRFTVERLAPTIWQVSKNGTPVIIGSKSIVDDYLAKWARA